MRDRVHAGSEFRDSLRYRTTMTVTPRYVPIVSVVLLSAVALSGCGAKDTKTAATSSASAAATTATSAVKPAGDKVAAADLPAVVSDRTYRGDDQGKPYAEYYAPDGSLRGKNAGEAYAGSWKVVGEQLCFTYPKEGSTSEVDCYSVFKSGDVITWVGSDGKVVAATYVEGNPDKL